MSTKDHLLTGFCLPDILFLARAARAAERVTVSGTISKTKCIISQRTVDIVLDKQPCVNQRSGVEDNAIREKIIP